MTVYLDKLPARHATTITFSARRKAALIEALEGHEGWDAGSIAHYLRIARETPVGQPVWPGSELRDALEFYQLDEPLI